MTYALTQQGYETILSVWTVVVLVALLGAIALGVLALVRIREAQSPVDCPKCTIKRQLLETRNTTRNRRDYHRHETTEEAKHAIRRSPLLDAEYRQRDLYN